jgi:hypothetical protein
MPMKMKQPQPPTDPSRHEPAGHDVTIGQQVMDSLGSPTNLRAVQVRRLWENRYRVNVFLGGDYASATVAHSYFLLTDSDGNILESTPQIIRKY